MKIAVFNTKPYDRQFFTTANREYGHELLFLEPHLNRQTVSLAKGFPGVCVFVNDCVDADIIQELSQGGTRLIALRCAGFNNVDLVAIRQQGLCVVRVPAYSPYSVAEHTVALLQTLNRKIHRAYNRIREGNFALDGLLGFDLHGRTVGVIGTGKIGLETARILRGYSCRLLAYDLSKNPECEALGIRYVPMDELFATADIITLHCPLTPQTHHLIDDHSLARMKPGVVILNTSRGGLIDTRAVIRGLKSGKIGYLGLDVYEEEGDLFFEDLSGQVIGDDVFARLLTFPNVLVTGHQAFFTSNALEAIADTTLANIAAFERGDALENEVTLGHRAK